MAFSVKTFYDNINAGIITAENEIPVTRTRSIDRDLLIKTIINIRNISLMTNNLEKASFKDIKNLFDDRYTYIIDLTLSLRNLKNYLKNDYMKKYENLLNQQIGDINLKDRLITAIQRSEEQLLIMEGIIKRVHKRNLFWKKEYDDIKKLNEQIKLYDFKIVKQLYDDLKNSIKVKLSKRENLIKKICLEIDKDFKVINEMQGNDRLLIAVKSLYKSYLELKKRDITNLKRAEIEFLDNNFDSIEKEKVILATIQSILDIAIKEINHLTNLGKNSELKKKYGFMAPAFDPERGSNFGFLKNVFEKKKGKDLFNKLNKIRLNAEKKSKKAIKDLEKIEKKSKEVNSITENVEQLKEIMKSSLIREKNKELFFKIIKDEVEKKKKALELKKHVSPENLKKLYEDFEKKMKLKLPV